MNIDRVKPKKSLGQNFIHDNNFLLKMNDFIISSKNNTIIEVGPGKGALTELLAKKKFKDLYLIEKDDFLAGQLKERYENKKNIIIIHDDALLYDFKYFNKKKKM